MAAYYTWPSGVVGLPPENTTNINLKELRNEAEANTEDLHLRSTQELMNYNMEALDGRIGHVNDFIVDTESWSIRFIVVDTRNWLPGGKQVLISVLWLMNIDWEKSTVFVDLRRTNIENSPEYDPAQPVNEEYEKQLFDYYGRPVEVEHDQ